MSVMPPERSLSAKSPHTTDPGWPVTMNICSFWNCAEAGFASVFLIAVSADALASGKAWVSSPEILSLGPFEQLQSAAATSALVIRVRDLPRWEISGGAYPDDRRNEKRKCIVRPFW